MVTTTDPRLVFLLARLDELEVAATAAVELGKIMTKHDDARMSTVNTWRWGLLSESVVDGRRGAGYSSMYCDGAPSPEAVLADVDSKRRIIALHEPELEHMATKPAPHDASLMGAWLMKRDVITELLRPFRDDPAFDQGWIP